MSSSGDESVRDSFDFEQRMFKTVPRAGLRRDADELEYPALKST